MFSAVGEHARRLRPSAPVAAQPASQHGKHPPLKEFGMNKDHVKGATNEVTGNIKKEVGRATGDRSMEVKGHARELKGKLQQGVGDAKDELRDDRDLDRDVDRDLD